MLQDWWNFHIMGWDDEEEELDQAILFLQDLEGLLIDIIRRDIHHTIQKRRKQYEGEVNYKVIARCRWETTFIVWDPGGN